VAASESARREREDSFSLVHGYCAWADDPAREDLWRESGWLAAARISAVIDARISGASNDEIRALVERLHEARKLGAKGRMT